MTNLRNHSPKRQYMRSLFIPIFSRNGPRQGPQRNVEVSSHKRALSHQDTYYVVLSMLNAPIFEQAIALF
jgi:hypothetical protein